MRTRVPAYYDAFHCLAGACPHSCCIGWEVVIDPETPNRQGPDFGSQDQTGVYWMDPADEAVIRPIAALEAGAVPFFAVELKPLICFYPAETYHQRYLEKHPHGYCHVAPWKLAALPAYPFSTEDYVLPAKVLLDQRREAESQER